MHQARLLGSGAKDFVVWGKVSGGVWGKSSGIWSKASGIWGNFVPVAGAPNVSPMWIVDAVFSLSMCGVIKKRPRQSPSLHSRKQ